MSVCQVEGISVNGEIVNNRAEHKSSTIISINPINKQNPNLTNNINKTITTKHVNNNIIAWTTTKIDPTNAQVIDNINKAIIPRQATVLQQYNKYKKYTNISINTKIAALRTIIYNKDK